MMNQGGTTATGGGSGNFLQGAPGTKMIIILVFVFYLVAESIDSHDIFELDMERVIHDGQLYRLFLCHVTYESVAELVMGLLALSVLSRRFEREMGTRKFGTFLFFVTILSTIFEVFLTQIFFSTGGDTQKTNERPKFIRRGGPHVHLGALLTLYHIYTPRLHPRMFGILGFDFSEKLFTYLFAAQSILRFDIETILPTICGAMAGLISSTPVLPLRQWELPNVIYSLVAATFGAIVSETPRPILLSPPHQRRRDINNNNNNNNNNNHLNNNNNPLAGMEGMMDNGFGGQRLIPPNAGRFQAPLPPPPPPEEAIEQLTSMGFDRDAVTTALRQTDNNVEAAANRLLLASG